MKDEGSASDSRMDRSDVVGYSDALLDPQQGTVVKYERRIMKSGRRIPIGRLRVKDWRGSREVVRIIGNRFAPGKTFRKWTHLTDIIDPQDVVVTTHQSPNRFRVEFLHGRRKGNWILVNGIDANRILKARQ